MYFCWSFGLVVDLKVTDFVVKEFRKIKFGVLLAGLTWNKISRVPHAPALLSFAVILIVTWGAPRS